jgi:hypothetical protein
MAAPDGYPFQEVRRNASACLSEALDWLHAEWDPNYPPTPTQVEAWATALRAVAEARRALLSAAASKAI